MARARRSPTNRDMILSLLVILIPVAIIAFLLTRGQDEPNVPTVDWKPVAAQAAKEAPYEVLAPAELPAGWRATQVSWTKIGEPDPTGNESPRNRWRLGVLTDQQVYIELDQVDKQAQDFVDDITRNGQPDGTSTVAGQSWQRLVTDDDRTRSLVLATPKVTTVVSGDTSYRLLEDYAGLLRAQP
ncbi:DUF4245 domain-containing protein [Microlunatus elymi]|uniref:DUF4245 domain-containing protein n=1 Tax=Microlunatus elymi TaxID=2596828 RepID=UPI00143CE5C9|nr:DUF4245 domain-containing protein [Microlunatus elymi]